MTLSAGTRLGPYEILGAIGAGGRGEVYRARDTRLDRTVAIKVLPPELSGDGERRERFQREARTLAALSHPRVCPLFDVGEHDGSAYLVMAHLEGETLAARLERGALPLPQALEIAAQIAEGLDAAHKRGIVHRDLKPGNVMLTRSGAVLLDFGLAKLRGYGEKPALVMEAYAPTAVETLTRSGAIMGTLHYMAPEQVQGKEADARADLWALGVILHEMLSGARPFAADTAASLLGAILERDPPPLSAATPGVPPGLERLVRRCLAKHPDERWESARDLADNLRWIAQDGKQHGATELAAPQPRWRRAAPFAATVLVGLLAGAGNAIEMTTRSSGELVHQNPHLLPGDAAVLFTARKRLWSWGDEAIVAQVLTTGERKTLLTDAADARYLPSGHLLFLRQGVLHACPFDLERLRVTGEPVALVASVSQVLTGNDSRSITGAGHVAVSRHGDLAYVTHPIVPYKLRRLVAIDRAGTVRPLPAPERAYRAGLRVSPDGGRLVLGITSTTEVGLWVFELARHTLTKLTPSGSECYWPQWSPDGRRVAFCWSHQGVTTLAW